MRCFEDSFRLFSTRISISISDGFIWHFFSHIRGQTLLVDPLPPINKVFSLVLQEECQREASSSVGYFNHNTAALMSKTVQSTHNRFGKQIVRNDRPTCSHCELLRHTMEKCYKLHGYPPRYKFSKNKTAPHSANQVQESEQLMWCQESPHIPQLSTTPK